ncbi:hypothetical protein QL285_044201 [Trifolium repens]|nr:hypothetical protein QL285_044201 [Trifolium repens]
MNNVQDTLTHHRQHAMQIIQNNFQNPVNNEMRLVLNIPENLTWRLAIDREVIQNPNLHQSCITYSWEQNAIPRSGGRGGGGRERGGVEVYGNHNNVYCGEGMTVTINHLNQGVGPNQQT